MQGGRNWGAGEAKALPPSFSEIQYWPPPCPPYFVGTLEVGPSSNLDLLKALRYTFGNVSWRPFEINLTYDFLDRLAYLKFIYITMGTGMVSLKGPGGVTPPMI